MHRRPPSFRRTQCLLRQAQRDPEAFAEFYDAYARRVLVFLTRRVVDAETAFDLMSETFAKALEHQHQFRGQTSEEEQGWLFAIARSELSHFWRRGAVEKASLATLGIPMPSLSSAEIERIEELAGLSQLRHEVGMALASLPDDQKKAVELRVVCELGYDEIASGLGISEEATRARVSRGLRTIRGQLEEQDLTIKDLA